MFNVGDKIRRTGEDSCCLKKGRVYTVKEYHPNLNLLLVCECPHNTGEYFNSDCFVPAKSLDVGDIVRRVSHSFCCIQLGSISSIVAIDFNGMLSLSECKHGITFSRDYFEFFTDYNMEGAKVEDFWSVGDKAVMTEDGECNYDGQEVTIAAHKWEGGVLYLRHESCANFHESKYFKKQKNNKTEEIKMELSEIKSGNLLAAKEKFDEERNNAEIEFAKNVIRTSTDEVNRIDREIKKLEEQKQPHLDVLKKFKSK